MGEKGFFIGDWVCLFFFRRVFAVSETLATGNSKGVRSNDIVAIYQRWKC
jgi:hypothetical protein